MKERANAALASLQRNACAMGMLRSRLESRINFLNGSGNTESCQELARMLELVRSGEAILSEMSEKVESARFLEEFIMIIDSAAASVGEIKGDMEQLVPIAEAAMSEMHDAIARVSAGMAPELRQEMDQAILAEVSAAIAAGNVEAVEEKEEEPEKVAA